MKILYFILSFYISILSIVPCCPDINCNDEVLNLDVNGQHETEENCETCSPFLSCANCSGFVMVQPGIFRTFQTVNTIIPFSPSLVLKNLISSIWQPPDSDR